jgi:hypothetical protein
MEPTGKMTHKDGTPSGPGPKTTPLVILTTNTLQSADKEVGRARNTHSNKEYFLDLITKTPVLTAEKIDEVVKRKTITPV